MHYTIRNNLSINGFIKRSCPPKVSDCFDPADPDLKPFFIKICGDIGKVSGVFMLEGIQCKIINEKLVPDITILNDSNFFYNYNTPVIKPHLVYLWNEEEQTWIDASTTTWIIKRRYDNRNNWLMLCEQLEKNFKFSRKDSRKLFKKLTLPGVEEFIKWLEFLKKLQPSKKFIRKVFSQASSKEDISIFFNFQCNNLDAAKEAMEYYLMS